MEGDHVRQETTEGDHVRQETMEGDVIQETMEGDVFQETMEGDHVHQETTEGDHVRQETMEGDVIQDTMEGDVVQETMEGDVVQETIEGDHVRQKTMERDVYQETMERDVLPETMEGDVVQETMEEDVCQEIMEEDIVNKKKRCRSSDEGSSMSYVERRVKPKTTKKIKPKKHDKENLSSPPPILPIHVENKIKEFNGTDIKNIMCKKLSASDLRDDQNRLLMPLKEVKVDFLTDIEKDESNKQDGLEVTVLDPSFREFTMSLRKWSMGTNKYYSLLRGWKTVVSKNSFKKGKKLNIWTFRVNDKLHFVLDNNQVML
ncbi:putative transcription factor B3-Domain family [Medicago truncatula]|nr:putative transcription factor B3-Domain family [Medicago truncatula]